MVYASAHIKNYTRSTLNFHANNDKKSHELNFTVKIAKEGSCYEIKKSKNWSTVFAF